MQFRSELDVRQAGLLEWKLLADLRYDGSKQGFIVPSDFITDFASVPGPFQWLIRRSGGHTKAAVLHDYLWRVGAHVEVPRSEADGIFRRVLHELGVAFIRRWVMWAAVRMVSLPRSRFRDRPADLLRMILVVFGPGLVLLAGGIVALVLGALFWALEWLAFVLLLALRLMLGERIKQPRKPSLFWRD